MLCRRELWHSRVIPSAAMTPSSITTTGSAIDCSGVISRSAVITVLIFKSFLPSNGQRSLANDVKSKSTLNRDEYSPYRVSPFNVGRRLQSCRTRPRDWREYLSDLLFEPAHVASDANRSQPTVSRCTPCAANMTARRWSFTPATWSTSAASRRRSARNPLPLSAAKLSARWPWARSILSCTLAPGAASRARMAWPWLRSPSPRQLTASSRGSGLPYPDRKHCRS